MLADQLGTTRQAVSKWENNQGYPETEKLLRLSHLFGCLPIICSKRRNPDKTADEKGYYVSRNGQRILANEKRGIRFLAFGLLCGALAGIPAVLFEISLP